MNFLNQTLDSLEDQIVELRRERNALRAENAGLVDDMNLLRDNNTALRAKIAEMEQQEPVGKFIQHPSHGMWEQDGYSDNPDAKPLYLAPGAQTQGERK